MSSNSQLRGVILFDELPPDLSGETDILLSVLDVTMTDAPAKTVATLKLASNWHEIRQQRDCPFVLTLPVLHREKQYVLSAHIDVDHSGTVTSGDFMTTESYPVSQVSNESVTIRVVQIS